MRVFVFEYLTAGGAAGFDEAVASELLPMGQAMRDAVVADLSQWGGCKVSAAVGAPGAVLPPEVDARQARPGELLAEFVSRESREHDLTWVVAPESGGLLAQMGRGVAPERWLGCTLGAIRVASSKRATLLRLAGRGIATPIAFERAPGVRHWVVKPDDGAGAADVRRHASRAAAWADADQRAHERAAVSVEPWIDGAALSLSMICRNDGAELLSVNRQHIAVDDAGAVRFEGVSLQSTPLHDAQGTALASLAGRVARAIPGLRGYVGVDLVWHAEHGPVVIEVNPRVTCAYVGLSAALGRNLAAELVAAAQPEMADALA